jgi:ABC-type polysaccharide/polyol phosphate transport system ATPase subunit
MTLATQDSPREASTEAAESAPAIDITGVGVRFHLPTEKISSFKEYVLRRLTNRIQYRHLWALKSIDLTVRRGETFGIVGRNGAGKSTLLKVISRVLQPTTGRIVVRGRVAPLLELGAGFHFDLTGRENVFLNATLLGHSHASVQRRLNQVTEFSELQDFFGLPVRMYSSGMLARLGFAVATLFRPEILILDEVLAVGDVGFRQKCLDRIEEFQAEGTSILYASHDLQAVASHCERVAWIDRGEVVRIGPAMEILDLYSSTLESEG